MRIKIFDSLPKDAIDIRTEVFVDEQGFTEEFDSDDLHAVHLVGYENDKAVATCRIIYNGDGSLYIGRIAVRKKFRKKGHGSQIVRAAERFIAEKGGHTVYIHSQEQAVPFYLRIGYADTGKCDFEEGCPHRLLIKSF